MTDYQTPWERAKDKSYQRQEKDLAGRGKDGKQQINSGRTSFASKRDLINWGFLIEARTTDSKTHTINAVELEKLVVDAVFHKQLPAMCFEFLQHRQEWILLRQVDFEWIQSHIKILEEEIDQLKRKP